MRAKVIFLTVALCFTEAALCFADNAHMGTWKLKEAKPWGAQKPHCGVRTCRGQGEGHGGWHGQRR
jgi:hypothetical protein